MMIKGLLLYQCQKEKNGGLFHIGASLSGQKDDFKETMDWTEDEEWVKDLDDLDVFAVAYHTINVIRKKHPFLYIIVSKIIIDKNSQHDVKFDFNELPHMTVNTNFAPSTHEGYIYWSKLESVILSLDITDDIKQFAEAIYSLFTPYWFSFLLCKDENSLKKIKSDIDKSRNPQEFEKLLNENCNVLIYVNNEGDIEIKTQDEEIIQALCKNPRHPRAKKRFFKRR